MLPAVLSACATQNRPECAAGTPALVFHLYFGKSIPGRAELAEREWQSFLEASVTPALPGGYTVLEAEGAWMSPHSHRTIREHTKVLVVALPDSSESWTAVNQVRASYQAKFRQQLVGLIASKGCADF
ncbi:MAG TPA: DUF3574 domain-containing protein [Rhodopila sp.]|nr:DUF3574 domain-containing protein [Rhodopila sp.]